MQNKSFSLTTWWSLLGPGLLMAGAAIGVSHIVQATRAGAEYGWLLLVPMLLSLLFKYPFFEYGHRYTAATGENLLQGYRRLGSGFLWLFLLFNAVTAVISIAGVSLVTAALLQYLTGWEWGLVNWTSVVILGSALLVAWGHYHWLKVGIKWIMVLLALATLAAFILALAEGPVAPPDWVTPSPWNLAGFAFLIALLGWMPAPIEVSVWQSLWIQAGRRDEQGAPAWGAVRLDFVTGYLLTIVLAVFFLGLGALVVHGSGQPFAESGVAFPRDFIEIYTARLGAWTGPLVAIAAAGTMLSTSLTVIDAYPRSLSEGLRIACGRQADASSRRWHQIALLISCAVAISFIVLALQLQQLSFKLLIDSVTAIAFITAPIFAWLNMRLLRAPWVPESLRPGVGLTWLARVGLAYLLVFSLIYIGHRMGLY